MSQMENKHVNTRPSSVRTVRQFHSVESGLSMSHNGQFAPYEWAQFQANPFVASIQPAEKEEMGTCDKIQAFRYGHYFHGRIFR